MHPLPRYEGRLGYSNLTGLAKRAYACFMNQRRRCYTKTNPRYKDNGAKGITVEYGVREFIHWYVENIKKFKGNNPSVGRIDHSKSYSFCNIRFESLADNSMERIVMVGTTKPRRPVLAIHIDTGEVTYCESGFAAARLTGIRTSHVSKYCNGVCKRSQKGYTLRYADE